MRLAADTGHGSANLAWLVHEKGIEPHIAVFEKSPRAEGMFSRSDLTFDHREDAYICPGGKQLKRYQRAFATPRDSVGAVRMMRYRTTASDCGSCSFKSQCCPTQPQRKVLRSIHEESRDLARDLLFTDAYLTSRRERKNVEMLFAHLKHILRLDRLRLPGPNGENDEFLLAATAQNLRKLAMLIPMPEPMLT